MHDRKQNKRRRKNRLALLRSIVDQIMKGEFSGGHLNPHDIYKSHIPNRNEYFSPLDRSAYNWGYMTTGEIGSGNYEAV